MMECERQIPSQDRPKRLATHAVSVVGYPTGGGRLTQDTGGGWLQTHILASTATSTQEPFPLQDVKKLFFHNGCVVWTDFPDHKDQ